MSNKNLTAEEMADQTLELARELIDNPVRMEQIIGKPVLLTDEEFKKMALEIGESEEFCRKAISDKYKALAILTAYYTTFVVIDRFYAFELLKSFGFFEEIIDSAIYELDDTGLVDWNAQALNYALKFKKEGASLNQNAQLLKYKKFTNAEITYALERI